jgi:hypothetical protein
LGEARGASDDRGFALLQVGDLDLADAFGGVWVCENIAIGSALD